MGLANIAWAFATLEYPDDPLFTAISSAALPKLDACTTKDITSTVWAFATLRCLDQPLLEALAAASIRNIESSDLAHQAQPPSNAVSDDDLQICSYVHAFNSLDDLEDGVLAAAERRLGRRSDALDGAAPVPARLLSAPRDRGGLSKEPYVLQETADVCVLYKPPQWLCSVGDISGWGVTSEAAGVSASSLQDWVVSELGAECAVSRDASAQFGIIHRLDVDTSGALVCAKTYRGYFFATLQFTSKRVYKGYVCLCHGHFQSSSRFIETRLRRKVGTSFSEVCEQGGRQARTEICNVRHITAKTGGEQYSLVEVRLHTGRHHQIRAHFAGEGHALVGDASYGASPSSQGWCPRVFLHTHRVELEVDGVPIKSRCPLPQDLRAALETLGVDADDAESFSAKA